MSDEIQTEGSHVREGQRIAKVMARAGVCSRRDAEAWIAEGRVSVNGEVLTSPAFNVSETDDVRVDGQRLAAPERTRLFLFHKPRGLVTTARDPEGRNTVFAVLPPDLPRVVAIGRLDINTEGLLLLTNDGGLARVLELPSTGWLRRYRVRAHGAIDQGALDRLAGGVTIDGVTYLGIEAKLDREQGANAWLTLGLREGKNREIKKILEHLGLAVNRLIRVSFGPFELGDLPEGEVMEVRTRVLRDQLGVKLAKEANVNFDAPQTIAVEPAAGAKARRAGPPRIGGPSERCPADRIAGRAGATIASNGRPRRAARLRRRRRPSAAANMSRPCAPKSPRRRPPRASASSAARPTTARGERSRSSACRGPSRRPRPKRGRSAKGLRTRPSAAGARSSRAAAPIAASPSGPGAGAPQEGASDRRIRTRGTPGVGRSGLAAMRSEGGPRERRFDRPEAKRDGDRRDGPPRTRGPGGPPRERKFDRPQGRPRPPAGEGRPARTDDKSRGPRSDFKPRPPRTGAGDGDRPQGPGRGARVEGGPPRERKFDRPRQGRPPSDRTARTAVRAPTSSRGRLAREGMRETGRRAPAAALAAKAARRAAAPRLGRALASPGAERRKAPAVRAGRRESREGETQLARSPCPPP